MMRSVVAIGFLVFVSGASGQTDFMKDCGCDKLTAPALLTVRAENKAAERESHEQSFFCYAQEESVRELVSSYANLGLTLPDTLEASFGNGYSSDALKTYRSQHCQSMSSADAWKRLSSTYEQFAPNALFEAVQSCLKICKDSEALYCNLTPVDAVNLTLFVRWRPSQALSSAQLLSLAVTGGNLVVTSNIGGDPLVHQGQELIPGGLLVPVTRNSATTDVRATLNTTQGSCIATAPALESVYSITATIRANGTIVSPQQKSVQSAPHGTHPDCDGHIGGAEVFCFDDPSIRAVSIGNFAEMSGNCGRGVVQGGIGVGGVHCAAANWHADGCGYKDYGIAKDCKGNGWITYGAVLVGEKDSPAPESVFQRTDTLRLQVGQSGSVSYQFPMDQVAAWRNPSLMMDVSISRTVAGKEGPSIALNSQQVAVAGAEMSFDPATGTGVVTIRNVAAQP